MRRLLPTLAISIPLVSLFFAWHLSATTSWLTPFEIVISCALVAASLVTIPAVLAGWRRVSIAVPVLLLAANVAFMLARAFGVQHLGSLPPPEMKFAIVICAAIVLGIVGLVARRHWGRWLGLAFGAAAIGCGGLNLINYWKLSATPNLYYPDWYADVCRTTCFHMVTLLGGVVIVINTVAASDAFKESATWSRRDGVIRWLRASMIATFVAVPMLLVYAWMQPLVASTKPTALVLAVVLAIGGFLGVRGKLVGALLLVLGGAGLAVQTAMTMSLAHGPVRTISYYYAAFWIPCAAILLVTGCLLARPTLRLLRG
ncbi:MAG TPA: hypothetical protein VL326_23280 [Kofleriaceae bacterium]|nr:hypothetical protein [Kofleriaceae bacterium]